MPNNPNKPVIKSKEEVIADLTSSTTVDPVQQQILETLLDIRDSLDSLPGNRRRMMQRGQRPDLLN